MRSTARPWTDANGRKWRVWLNTEERFRPGALLVFSADPKDSLASPKIMVRGIANIYTIPEASLPFFFAAAESGGFVWRDRDGRPWHLVSHTRMLAESGRAHTVRHAESQRVLWAMSDEELEEMVGMAVG